MRLTKTSIAAVAALAFGVTAAPLTASAQNYYGSGYSQNYGTGAYSRSYDYNSGRYYDPCARERVRRRGPGGLRRDRNPRHDDLAERGGMISIRFVITLLGVAFTAFLVARAAWITGPVANLPLLYVTMVVYLVSAWLCIFWGISWRSGPRSGTVTVGRGTERLPMWVCLVALVVSMVLPPAIAVGVGPGSLTEQYATWYIGGLGAIMTILVVRRRPWPAWPYRCSPSAFSRVSPASCSRST